MGFIARKAAARLPRRSLDRRDARPAPLYSRGRGDRAATMGWRTDKVYRLPPPWRRIELTGVKLLIGELQVIAVTEDSIICETVSGSRLRFRRTEREHLT